MVVKIGNSYVSEMAASFAQAAAEDFGGGNILKDLAEKFPNLKFSVGQAPFSGTGKGNVAISPKILREMENNPEKRVEYEALLYDVANLNWNNNPTVKSSGVILDGNGGLSMWSISKSDGGTSRAKSPLDKNNKSWWQKILDSLHKNSDAPKTLTEFLAQLRQKFSVVKNGHAAISEKYLRDCLKDDAERQKLFDNLQAADKALAENQKRVGFQNMTLKIDDKGNATAETSSGKVGFNEEKRARQLAAAQCKDDVRALLELLRDDLEDCKAGVEKNMCDESEVQKVEAMIERARKRLSELDETPPKFPTVDLII